MIGSLWPSLRRASSTEIKRGLFIAGIPSFGGPPFTISERSTERLEIFVRQPRTRSFDPAGPTWASVRFVHDVHKRPIKRSNDEISLTTGTLLQASSIRVVGNSPLRLA